MEKTTEKLIATITNMDKPLYIRYGFGWKGATWSKTSAEALVDAIQKANYAHYDVMNVQDGIGISFYSANDML